jgi:hypothetical protein
VLDGVVCYGQLSGKITALNYDLAAGNGNTVNVPYVSPRTESCATSDACGCLSAASTTFGEYPIEIEPNGDYDLVCNWSTYQARPGVMGKIMNEMSKRLAKCRDAAIWTDLTGATPNTTITSSVSFPASRATDSCCNYTYDLYNMIIDAQKHLQGDAYEPDTVILHPLTAVYLYYKENGDMPQPTAGAPLVKYDGSGQLVSIAGMKVIECCNATAPSTASGAVLGIVLDSKRAEGEAWGKRPTFSEFYDAKCDRTELVLWTYWGAAVLDPDAIVHLANP